MASAAAAAAATGGGMAVVKMKVRALLTSRSRSGATPAANPPPVAAAAAAALAIVAGPEGERRRTILDGHRRVLGAGLVARGLRAEAAPGPIASVVLGTEARALTVAAALRDRGLWVPAIRPPTVPPGTARLRITLSAEHEGEDVAALADALAEAVA